ncbi:MULTISPECIES: ATP-binding protein [unclassified Rhizobium]|uniref:sensor histidine kinase n=1 Tax=unclassified Rhizobium TaxID=2613769 RepID=UPI0015D3FF72|nr:MULTISPECIES: ATP-binding protein [unclassified Rhizobium]MBA1347062.1 PAS domain S-box protein [Rhizobium sp. WYCCWR 11146]NYT34635.1 PAS domain S-box protein [Rhizobium sp. WYCCWR 11128]
MTLRFADLPLRAKGIVIITVPLALLLAALASVFVADRQSRIAEDQVRVTLEIQSGIQEIHASIAEAATAMRGYLLTGRTDFLDPFNRAEDRLPVVLDEVGRRLRDDEQKSRLERIRTLVVAKVDRLQLLKQADILRAGGREDLAAKLIEGKQVLDVLRQEIDAMSRREADLLHARTEAADRVRTLSRSLMIAAGFLGFAGALVAVFLFSASIVRRVHALKAEAHRLAQGEVVMVADPFRDELGSLGQALEDASVLLKKREADLTESEERFRQLVEGVSDYGIFGLDTSGRVISWNAGAERITGYGAEEIVGQHFSRFYPTETRDTFPAEELAEAALHGRTEAEGWRVRKDGSQFWSHVVVTALHNETGWLRGFSKITRDITERKQIEEALLGAREDAIRASNAKSEFLSRMSHELRTPLNSVLGFAQLLEMDVTDTESRESVAQILRAGRHLLSLIDEVLDMARIEAGHMDLAVEAQPVAEVIDEAVSLARPLCGKQQITIEVVGPVEPDLSVLADRRRLLQVFLNLLSNAVKYNRPQGSVTVSHRAMDGGRIRIEVSDTGPGIPAERVSRLFTPFDRLGAERISQEGTGLGLALSKHLIEAMGGTLGFSNRKGGATFQVDLPRAPAAVEARPVAMGSPP